MKFLFVFFLFFTVVISGPSDGHGWHKHTYPHPVKDKFSCGRRGVESWVCDPDGVLKFDEVNVLEEMLQHVAKNTNSGCSVHSYSNRPGYRGYQVGVAVMKKMVVPWTMSKENFAEEFAKHLHNKWGVGHFSCDDGALVLLSVEDRQVYISTGRMTKEKLSDFHIDMLIDKIKLPLRNKEYGKALHLSVELMHQVFRGEDFKVDSLSWYTKLCLIFLLVLALGSTIYSYWQYKNCKEKLKRIERDINAAKNSKSYISTSCPICLENFTPQMPPRPLLCGHTYCEPCSTKWLETNTTCPMCRQSTNCKENNDTEETTTLNYCPELAFRLTCLQKQYPTIITPDRIRGWTSKKSTDTDSFVVDLAFCQQAKPFRSTGTGIYGTGGGFGGGSCSGGGGRGGSYLHV